MSLTTFALRIAAVRALRGNTLASDRVFDSEIIPLDQIATAQKAPFISVYTDEEKTISITGRDILGAQREIELSFEVAVSTQVDVTVTDDTGGTTSETQVSVPQTDAALEAQLNIVGRQITRALLDPDNAWAEIWRKMIVRIIKIDEKRGAMSQNGLRFAARQFIFSCAVIAEPSFTTPTYVWDDLVKLMGEDPDMVNLSLIIASEIKTPNIDEWKASQVDLGLTYEGWLGLQGTYGGLAPVTLDEEELAAVVPTFEPGILDEGN